MRLQKTTLILGSLSTLLIPLAAYGGPGSKIVTVWEERPRFFTAEPGEEHSRFTKIFWYDRPRLFTRAESEEHSRFYRLVNDRPRIFTKHHRCCAKTLAYAPTCATTVAFEPICSKSSYRRTCSTCPTRLTSYFGERTHCRTHARHCGTRCGKVAYRTPGCGFCDPCGKSMEATYSTATTFRPDTSTGYVSVTSPSDTMYDWDAPNSYGSAIHSNVTLPPVPGAQFTLTGDPGTRSLDAVIANWPQESRTAALAMQSKYGMPDSIRNDQIIWRDQEPWAEITVSKNGTPHAYPTPHNDVLAQSIYLDVDAAQLEELSDFQANIKADHSRGLLTSKCKDEAMNFLALNLAHEILEGEKSVVEANNMLGEKVRSGKANDEYMSGLRFDVGTEISGENMNVHTDSDIDVDRE